MSVRRPAPSGKHVPLTMGSPTSRTADVGPFKATDAWFPPNLVLDMHLHDRSALVVVLEGSFKLEFTGKSYDCLPSTVITEPLDDKHGNRFGTQGARVLVLQPDHGQPDHYAPCRRLLDSVTDTQHGGIQALAWRIAHELRRSDTVSPLAVQGLGLEIFAATARLKAPRGRVAPAWLDLAEEMLRAHFLDALDLDLVAETVGVHPVHLARVFKHYYGETIGTFTRRLRLEWSAVQLAATDTPIAQLALTAGFADQSHFTRAFKQFASLPPGRYRREVRG